MIEEKAGFMLSKRAGRGARLLRWTAEHWAHLKKCKRARTTRTTYKLSWLFNNDTPSLRVFMECITNHSRVGGAWSIGPAYRKEGSKHKIKGSS